MRKASAGRRTLRPRYRSARSPSMAWNISARLIAGSRCSATRSGAISERSRRAGSRLACPRWRRRHPDLLQRHGGAGPAGKNAGAGQEAAAGDRAATGAGLHRCTAADGCCRVARSAGTGALRPTGRRKWLLLDVAIERSWPHDAGQGCSTILPPRPPASMRAWTVARGCEGQAVDDHGMNRPVAQQSEQTGKVSLELLRVGQPAVCKAVPGRVDGHRTGSSARPTA